VVTTGTAQEYQKVFTARTDTDPTIAPEFSFDKTDRRKTCY
jgi:hypothetical protein